MPACPTGAFDGDDGVRDLLNCVARLEPARVIELVCAQHPAPEVGPSDVTAVVRTTTCLAALGPSAYLGLIALGLQRVTVRLDACAECPIGQARTSIAEALSYARQLLAVYGLADRVVEQTTAPVRRNRPVYTAKNPPLSRRGLFHMFAAEGPRQIARVLTDENEPSKIKSPSLERRRLINALRRLPATNGSISLNNLPFARITANDKCTACGVCARICPTGALNLIAGDDSTYQLAFNSAACIACDACVNLCEPEALGRSTTTLGDVLSSEVVALRSGTLRSCAKCSAKFAAEAGGELCPICEFRRSNPFGSRLPPGVLRSRAASQVSQAGPEPKK
ncbi:MAG TPA: 4Fe-4S binding protein [Anaerolineae bacterium]|nr:4Fe-4S binding protein [Anaerolineae bacterium]